MTGDDEEESNLTEKYSVQSGVGRTILNAPFEKSEHFVSFAGLHVNYVIRCKFVPLSCLANCLTSFKPSAMY